MLLSSPMLFLLYITLLLWAGDVQGLLRSPSMVMAWFRSGTPPPGSGNRIASFRRTKLCASDGEVGEPPATVMQVLEAFRAESAALRKQLSDSTAESAAFRGQLSEESAAFRGQISAEMAAFRGQLSAVQGQLSAVQDQQSAMQDQQSATQDHIVAMDQRSAADSAAVQGQLSAVENKISAVENKISAVNATVADINVKANELIKYNENRDKELEDVAQMAVVKQLQHDGFSVVNTALRKLFSPNGSVFVEFDGILLATHPNHTDVDFLFVLETKQLMNMNKFNDFRQKLHKFEHEYLSSLAKPESIKYRKSRVIAVKLNKLLRQDPRASTGRVLKVKGVICSPHIPPNVMKRLKKGDRFVTTIRDQYVCSQVL
jgi:hypothetical protein